MLKTQIYLRALCFCFGIVWATNLYGKTLTPIGAEQAGNEDASIPGWQSGWSDYPKQYKPKKPYILPNPFVSDEVLFIIDQNNLEQYQGYLSEGQKAMLKRNPDSFKMNIYPSRRVVSYPDKIYQATKANQGITTLVNGGSGLANYEIGVPFLEPEEGIQVVWNHVTRYRGENFKRRAASFVVQENGDYTKIVGAGQVSFAHSLKDGKGDSNILFYLKNRIISPPRMAGDVLLVHETFDQLKTPRKAWVYSSGQRRVRQIPEFSYDSSIPFSEGFIIADQVDMYNGSPDRYEWTLKGKQEMFIPYNSYQLASRDLKYDDILQIGHLNPEHLRYEKHRVWVVEGVLKENVRHIYGKRVFYVDEDTWQISVVDYYDERGELWRLGEAFGVYFYHEKIPLYLGDVIYDLQSNRYVLSGIANEEKKALQFGIRAKAADYTPAALRRESR